MSEPLLWVVVGAAVAGGFVNGFHDTASQVSTMISTRAVAPRTAVLLAAVLSAAGAAVGSAVAITIGTRLLSGHVPLRLLLAAILAAILWNLVIWRLGLPGSSTHALIGGLVGAALVCGGGVSVHWSGVVGYALIPAIAAPAVALGAALAAMLIVLWTLRTVRPAPANRALRTFQIVSGGLAAVLHGVNDAQKTTALIALALLSAHHTTHFSIPWWARVAAGLALGLGTYAGGWRFMRTIGTRIAQLEPAGGVAAETATVVTLAASAATGLAIASTQVRAAALVGAGAGTRLSASRWGVTRPALVVWIATPVAGAVLGAGAYAALAIYV